MGFNPFKPPKPPKIGGLPKPPGLGGLPKPPSPGGLPKPPGLGGLPKPPGLGGLPKPPGLGGGKRSPLDPGGLFGSSASDTGTLNGKRLQLGDGIVGNARRAARNGPDRGDALDGRVPLPRRNAPPGNTGIVPPSVRTGGPAPAQAAGGPTVAGAFARGMQMKRGLPPTPPPPSSPAGPPRMAEGGKVGKGKVPPQFAKKAPAPKAPPFGKVPAKAPPFAAKKPGAKAPPFAAKKPGAKAPPFAKGKDPDGDMAADMGRMRGKKC